MARIVVLANEPPWPDSNGGRARMAGLVDGLRSAHEVVVLVPSHPRHGELGTAPSDVTVVELPPAARRRARGVGRKPRLATSLLDTRVMSAVREHVDATAPLAVVCSHSYLAAIELGTHVPVIVDFPNLEVDRSRSLAQQEGGARRLVQMLEHVKARTWEPRVARAAAVCLAVTGADHDRLRTWGAREVLVVPNVATAPETPPALSPPSGYALTLAAGGYGPNARGLSWLLTEVWPRVLEMRPEAHLVVAGPQTESIVGPLGTRHVEARGFVADLAPLYRDASVVLAPVSSGAGSQLKVLTALAHGRTLVATTYSTASVPEAQSFAVCTADDAGDFASAVVRSMTDISSRHDKERRLGQHPPPGWPAAVAPLQAWLHELVRSTAQGRASGASGRSS